MQVRNEFVGVFNNKQAFLWVAKLMKMLFMDMCLFKILSPSQ